MSPVARETKTKINKLDYIKQKSLCIAKKTINKTKDNLQSGRRYSAMIYPIEISLKKIYR